MKIIHKARILETRIRIKHETKKQLRTQRYRIFLQQKTGHLPTRKKLYRWRRNFLVAASLCIAVPCLQVTFWGGTIWDRGSPVLYDQEASLGRIWVAFLNETPIIFGMLFLMFWCFGMAIDWVIYRRWGSQFTMMKWETQ